MRPLLLQALILPIYSNFCFPATRQTIRSVRRTSSSTSTTTTASGILVNMSWGDTRNDILQGGSPRWKVTDSQCHENALAHMKHYMKEGANQILCPLAGDDPMVCLLWQQGHSVTAMDLVPAALEQMRQQFPEGSWSSETRDNGIVVWKHESGRATQYQGDALQLQPELKNTFDAVYDKDSYGALSKEMRAPFCTRIGDYAKEGAIVYLECKLKDNHDEVKDVGPPFSLKQEDLMEPTSYGKSFDYVTGLGSVYPIPIPGMQQTGHILKRKGGGKL